jgi:ring-1,2-phenylacetyl-CoA epoxidase subunit PaaD
VVAPARVSARDPQEVWNLLGTIADPEIPVISIVDLGIIRSVELASDGAVEVGVTPTYSGCPATEVIRAQIAAALEANGCVPYRLREVLSPPWTSDWITPNGRARLLEYGIAPPADAVARPRHLVNALPAACPRCRSADTETVSEFGSTPCKSLRRCRACREPFEYFKCI